jgi:hypothetical protein
LSNEISSVQEETVQNLAQYPGGNHHFMQGVQGPSGGTNSEDDLPAV